MSYVMAEPQMMAAAASDVAAISSTVSAAHMAAAAPTVSLIPAAADQVSTGIAQFFSGVAQDFHALVGQAATFGQHFAQQLHLSAGAYTAAEAVSAASLSLPNANSLVSFVNSLPGLLLSGPMAIINGITNTFNTIATIFKTFVNAIFLTGYVAYEFVVFAYLTLAGLIALEFALAKLLGVPVTIPTLA